LSLDTEIGKNTIVEPFVIILRNVKICDNVKVLGFSHLEGVEIKEGASVGPYARIRPNTIIGESSKIGNFVEIKQSNIGSKTKVNHLSYVGDSTIYNNVNVGAGVITCNYDGYNKFKTKIGNNVFIGSNTALIAPIEIESEVEPVFHKTLLPGFPETFNFTGPLPQIEISWPNDTDGTGETFKKMLSLTPRQPEDATG
jgi:bifunctional UDP-N-acetylglucosamine pyrophosphorylase/glucosamine-1-phosphate N-acetyltransferase